MKLRLKLCACFVAVLACAVLLISSVLLVGGPGMSFSVLVVLVAAAALFSILAGAAVCFFFVAKIIEPIVRIREVLKGIAEGGEEMTAIRGIEPDDEAGDLVCYFNMILAKLDAMSATVKHQAFVLLGIGRKMASGMRIDFDSNVRSGGGGVEGSATLTDATLNHIVVDINASAGGGAPR
jgi:methyl-accepting chemotaxis protein